MEPLCAHCFKLGKITAATVVDHIIALSNGGADIDTNTQSLCDPCHEAKTALDLGYRVKPKIGLDGWPEQ